MPSTTWPEEALSAMVSTMPIRQSAMRLSITSSAGATASVAARTSSIVRAAPASGARSLKAISASTRGARNLAASRRRRRGEIIAAVR